MAELVTRQLLKEKIKLEAKYITKQFREEILHRLKQKVEAVCSKHGYIRRGSIDIFKIAPGVIETASLNGCMTFDTFFYADICNPLVGSVIKAKVVNMNRFGILAEARIEEDNTATSILEIIIAKNSVNFISDVDLENIKLHDDLYVEILGKKFSIGDKKISVIGKAVKDPTRSKPYFKTAPLQDPAFADEDDTAEPYVEPFDADEPAEDDEEEDAEGEDAEGEDVDGEDAFGEDAAEDDAPVDEDDEDVIEKKGGSAFFSDDDFAEGDNDYELFDESGDLSDGDSI